MWSIPALDMTARIVDCTADLSLLLMSLIAVLWLAAGVLTVTALQHFQAQTHWAPEKTRPIARDDRAAA